jgi:hypothetical protein
MLAPNPTESLKNIPVVDMVVLLLRQFKRLLSQAGVDLTTDEMTAIGQAAAACQAMPEKTAAIKSIMVNLVQESLDVLQKRFQRSFAASLATDMNTLGGWETTAEFLDIAEVKSNAELRISAGAALLALLGEVRFADCLISVLEHDAGADDVDALFARRALAHISQIPADVPDWLAQVQAWLQKAALS